MLNGKVVFGWGENDFLIKWFFNFPLFDTVKDEKLFFKKMIFPPMEENDFHFEKIGSWIYSLNYLMMWFAEI